MRKVLLILAVLLPLAMSCTNKVKDISVTSVELLSVSPRGLFELNALVRVGIHNPAPSFELTEVQGTVKIKGQEALVMDADQLIVSGRTDKMYNVPVHGSISPGFNPFQLLNFLNSSTSLEDVTLDVSARVAIRGGIGKKLEYKDIKVSNLIRK